MSWLHARSNDPKHPLEVFHVSEKCVVSRSCNTEDKLPKQHFDMKPFIPIDLMSASVAAAEWKLTVSSHPSSMLHTRRWWPIAWGHRPRGSLASRRTEQSYDGIKIRIGLYRSALGSRYTRTWFGVTSHDLIDRHQLVPCTRAARFATSGQGLLYRTCLWCEAGTESRRVSHGKTLTPLRFVNADCGYGSSGMADSKLLEMCWRNIRFSSRLSLESILPTNIFLPPMAAWYRGANACLWSGEVPKKLAWPGLVDAMFLSEAKL